MKIQFLKFPLVLLAMVLAVVACNKDEFNLNQPEIALQDAVKVIKYASDVIPNQYIVVLDEEAVSSSLRNVPSYPEAKQVMMTEARKVLREHRLSNKEIMMTYASAVKGFVANLTDEEALEVASDPNIKYVEQDRMIHRAGGPPPGKGPGGGDGGDDGGTDPAQTTPWGITRVNGGATYTGSNVAWVLDSGIDLDHPDLNVDASRGFNAFTRGKDGKSLDDGDGHGTHVAGTIAAIDNSIGVIGVAAGATVIPVKVLDSNGSGSYSGVIAGVDHVGANGSAGDVANMSLGGPVSQALDDAVVAAASGGISFTLAAGNSGTDANNSSPARANGANVYTISAMSEGDNFASFSNYGNPPVDYCEPGVSIESTWKDGGYNTISGTSMAAPHAAGILLFGGFGNGGTVNGDPDGNADTIGVVQ